MPELIELTKKEFQTLKNSYDFATKIKQYQKPLSKKEITHLRRLIKEHIEEGFSNYLRLVSVYSENRDEHLGIYVRRLYESLLNLKISKQ